MVFSLFFHILKRLKLIIIDIKLLIPALRFELKLFYGIFPYILVIAVNRNDYLDKLSEYVNAVNLAFKSFRCCNKIAYIRQSAVKILICILLILKAAHKSPAYSRYLAWIK